MQFATNKATKHGRLITIINWDSYQPKDKGTTKIATKEQQRSNKGATPNKNERMKERKNKDINTPFFIKFWGIYNKKKDKKKCADKFNKLNQKNIDIILQVLPEYIKATPDKRYRKNPLTYLNGECWNDEIGISKNDVTQFVPKTDQEIEEIRRRALL